MQKMVHFLHFSKQREKKNIFKNYNRLWITFKNKEHLSIDAVKFIFHYGLKL